MKIKHLVFDWSGTLFNDFDVSFISTLTTLQKFGGPLLAPFTKEEYRKNFTIPVWKFYRHYLDWNIPIDDIDDFYFDHFKIISKKARLFKEVKQILNLAQKNKQTITIFSTVPESILKERLEQFKLNKLVTTIVGGVRDKEKSLPQFVKNKKWNPQEVLYIGDTDHDIVAAHKAKVRSGALLCGYHTQEKLLKERPHFVWNDHEGLLKFLETLHHQSKQVDSQFPVATVGALLIYQDEIFLMQTHKWGNRFGIPGGKIKKDETSLNALKREIKEETGLTIKNPRFVLVQDSINSKEFYKNGAHFILINYQAEVSSKKFKLNDEAESGIWIRPKEALELNLNQPTRVLIEHYLKEIQ